MPGWPYQGEAAVHLAVHDRHTDRLGSACADEMGLGHHRPGIRNAKVHPLHILDRDQVRLVFENAFDIQQPLFEHLVLRIQQALFTFRVGWADGPIKGREKDKTGFVFGA